MVRQVISEPRVAEGSRQQSADRVWFLAGQRPFWVRWARLPSSATNCRVAGIFLAVAALPLVIPYVILGVSLLILFNEIGIPLSAFAAGMAHVIISIPYAMLIVASRLVGFPDNLEEAAMDLGASYWGALLRVTIPICSPALLAAFLLCFTMSFDEFAIASFLVGTDATLPVYLYSQLRFPTRLPTGRSIGSHPDDGYDSRDVI